MCRIDFLHSLMILKPKPSNLWNHYEEHKRSSERSRSSFLLVSPFSEFTKMWSIGNSCCCCRAQKLMILGGLQSGAKKVSLFSTGLRLTMAFRVRSEENGIIPEESNRGKETVKSFLCKTHESFVLFLTKCQSNENSRHWVWFHLNLINSG